MHRDWRRILTLIAVLVAVSLVCTSLAVAKGKPPKDPPPPPPPPAEPYVSYTLTDLGPAGDESWVEDLNDAGEVVGHIYPGWLAFVWDPLNGMQSLGFDSANGINDVGELVGYSLGDDEQWYQYGFYVPRVLRGVASEADRIPLPAPADGREYLALGINNLGQVVGSDEVRNISQWHQGGAGLFWDLVNHPADPPIELYPFRLYHTDGNLINDAGVMAGHVGVDWPSRIAAVAQVDAGGSVHLTELGKLSPDDAYNIATAINNLGQVVGYSVGGGKVGFLLTPEDTDGDGVPDLWYRDSDGDGANDLMSSLSPMNPISINDWGQTVGSLDNRVFSPQMPGSIAATSEDGVLYTLNDLIPAGSPALSNAYGINNAGQITGRADGRAHLLTPIPGAAPPIIHAEAIDLSVVPGQGKNWKRTEAAVTILDANGYPVTGARVYCEWSGAWSEIVSDITDADGRVTFRTPLWRVGENLTLTFTVHGATGPWGYDTYASVTSAWMITP